MKIAMKHVFLFGIFGWLLSFTLVAQTGIWQWSVPVHNFSTHPKNPESRAYLWIPGQCEQVKAILVALAEAFRSDGFLQQNSKSID